jgi:hypothetical protein
MRRKLVLGIGLAALAGGTAAGQFASDRVPAPIYAPAEAPKTAPAIPGGLTPVGSPAPAAPVVGGYQPLTPAAPTAPASPGGSLYSSPAAYVPPAEAPRMPAYGTVPGAPAVPVPNIASLTVNEVQIPTALPKDHPWLLKPEHGAYFIMVKSYVRPAAGSRAADEAREKGEKLLAARELAEGLASDIRDTYRVQALLYEYISEERKAEMRAYLIAKQKAETQYLAQVEAMKQKARLQGLDFMEPDNKMRIRKHDDRDQIGVLVGGFQNEADALKALNKLKTWPAPKNTALLDKGILLTPTADGKQNAGAEYMNPYATAFVVPNPAVTRAAQPQAQQGLDPFIVRLNEGRPYNLLRATKGWTLGVKSFSSPVELGGKEGDFSLARKFGMSKGGDVLAASAEQAEALAKALRAMKGPRGEALNLEAFVLHTRTASIVTIGQFDGPDDPAMQATKRLLAGMRATLSGDQTGMRSMGNMTLFDTMVPVPVPRQ